MPTINLGQVRPVYRGSWNSADMYVTYDFVIYNGSAYLALKDVPPNYEPSSQNEYWALFGAKGEPGTPGAAGAPGEKGDRGPALSHRWDGTFLSIQNPDGSFPDQGVNLQGPAVPLSNSVTSTSETDAASSLAVKIAYDAAQSKLPQTGGVVTDSLVIKNMLDLISAAPATEQELGLFMIDKNDAIMGGHDFVHNINNIIASQMYARNSNGLIASLGTYVEADGTRYTLSSHNLVITSDVEIGRLYADNVRLITFSGARGFPGPGLSMRYSPDTGELYLDGRAVHGKADSAVYADNAGALGGKAESALSVAFASAAQNSYGLMGMDMIIAKQAYTLPGYGTWKYMFLVATNSQWLDMVIGEDPGGTTFFPTQMGWPADAFMDGIAFRSA